MISSYSILMCQDHLQTNLKSACAQNLGSTPPFMGNGYGVRLPAGTSLPCYLNGDSHITASAPSPVMEDDSSYSRLYEVNHKKKKCLGQNMSLSKNALCGAYI